ncbi:MAG: hypothetical protein Q7J67_05840 [bacterium]|nr:hypothetical protein [bacterium]
MFFIIKDRKSQKIITTLLLVVLFFIFVAKGSNPPLGELYRFAIMHIPLTRMFRTSSTVVTGAVVFYAFLFSMAMFNLFRNRKVWVYVFIVLNVVSFYPIYFGYKFYNPIPFAPEKKGHIIPQAYFEIGRFLDAIKEDSKILSIPLHRGGYVEKNWGYFGSDLLSWITKKPLIYREGGNVITVEQKENSSKLPESYREYALNNAGYLLVKKDTVGGRYPKYDYPDRKDLLIRNDYFDLYKISDEYFLPHIYASTTSTIINGNMEALVPLTETKYLGGGKREMGNGKRNKQVLLFTEQDKARGKGGGKEKAKEEVKVEGKGKEEPEIIFKKINPTKYLVKAEGAKTPFWLVFSESFHKQWKIYRRQTTDDRRQIFQEIVADYPKLKVKEAKHLMKFTPQDIKFLFRKPLDAQHQLVNGYANGWYIEPKKLGLEEDFTLVLYFWPQSLFYLGLGISGLTLLCCLIYLTYRCFPFSVKRRGRG